MGMTIDEIIQELESTKDYPANDPASDEALDGAIDTMHKYQKIQKILNSASYTENGTIYSYTYDENTRIKHIREVLEEGDKK